MLIVAALGWQRAAASARIARRGGRAAKREGRPRARSPRSPASINSSSPTATVRRSGFSRCRARLSTTCARIRSTCSGAESEGMIGYLLERELGNVLGSTARRVADHPDGRRRARSRVPAPSKPIGPVYDADRRAGARARARLDDRAGRERLAPGRRIADSAFDRGAPDHPVAARTRRRGRVCRRWWRSRRRRFRRRPSRRRSSRRQGSGQRAARAPAVGRSPAAADRRLCGRGRLGYAEGPAVRSTATPAELATHQFAAGLDGARRSKRPRRSSGPPASGPCIGALADAMALVAGTAGTTIVSDRG